MMKNNKRKTNIKHIRFHNIDEVEKVRKKKGYPSFSEFVREAVGYYIGWFEGSDSKKNE